MNEQNNAVLPAGTAIPTASEPSTASSPSPVSATELIGKPCLLGLEATRHLRNIESLLATQPSRDILAELVKLNAALVNLPARLIAAVDDSQPAEVRQVTQIADMAPEHGDPEVEALAGRMVSSLQAAAPDAPAPIQATLGHNVKKW